MKNKRKTSSLHIDQELHAKFKSHCADMREPMQSVTEKMVLDKLSKNKIEPFIAELKVKQEYFINNN